MTSTATVHHILSAIFGPTGQDIVARFDARTEYDCQIWIAAISILMLIPIITKREGIAREGP